MIVQGLAAVADPKAAAVFREAVSDGDRDIRIAATWGLANIGDAGSADALLKAADGHKGWERIQHTHACLMLAENLAAAGKKNAAARIYTHLRDTRTKPTEGHIRKAAQRGLAIAT